MMNYTFYFAGSFYAVQACTADAARTTLSTLWPSVNTSDALLTEARLAA